MRRALLLPAALALLSLPAKAEEVSDEAAQWLTCGYTFSLRADAARDAGDEGGAIEFRNMGEALIGQAQTAMAEAGMDESTISNASDSNAMMTGLRYGMGEAEAMFDECLAAWDSP